MSVGTNLTTNDDWGTSRPWQNLKNMLRMWGPATQPWVDAPPPLSPDGYPLQDAGAMMALKSPLPGTYYYSMDGSGTISWGGARFAAATPRSGTVTITGDGNVWITITGVAASNPPKNLRIAHSKYVITATFTPEFLDSLKTFSAIRFMDWGRTNGSPLVKWADRTTPAQLQTTPRGVAVEYMRELCETAGKDAWVCVPHGADDDYLEKLATAWAGFTRNVYVEYSNEVWNGMFPQQKDVMAAAASLNAPSNYEGLYWQVAKRLKAAVEAFRRHLPVAQVRGVLAGQAANPWFVENGLKWLGKSDVVWAIAYADYFYPWSSTNGAPQGSLDDAFTSLNSFLDVDAAVARKAYAALAAAHGVANVVAYEAGIHVVGENAVYRSMQLDPRIGDAYRTAISRFTGPLWMNYAHVADWDGQYGYWGSKRTLDDVTPKWTAITGAATPVVAVPQPQTLVSVTVTIGGVVITAPASACVLNYK